MKVGELQVDFVTNVGKLVDEVAQINRAFGSIESSVGKAKGALAGLGVTLSVGAVALWAKNILDAHEQVEKMSQKLGIGVRELSQYKYALAQSDVSMQAFGVGVKTLSQRMVEAGDASGKAGKIMATLGVDLSRGTAPAIEKIAEVFKLLPDGATKAALAVELFGKQGMEMIPFLNQGTAGIRAMKEEALRLGIVMDEQATKAAERFNDNMKTIKASGERLGVTIVNDMAPSITRISNAMREAAIQGGALRAAWVGLGGVAAEALGLGQEDGEKVANRIRTLQDEVAKFRALLKPDRAADLMSGVAQAATMIEASFVRASFQLRGLLALMEAYRKDERNPRGGFEDQVARTMSQGKVLGVSGNPDEMKRKIDALLAGGDKVAKVAKDLDLADQHVVAYMKHLQQLAEAEQAVIREEIALAAALGQHIDAVVKQIEQEEFANQTRGMSRSQVESLTIARMEERLEILRATEGADLQVKALEREIELRRQLRDVIGKGEAQQAEIKAQQEQLRMWDELGRAAGDFFADLIMNGKSAFGNLQDYAKRFLADLIAIFARQWFLQIVGGMVGGSAGSAIAGSAASVGANTLTGAASSMIGNYIAGSSIGGTAIGTMGQFWGAATGAIPSGAIGANAVNAGVGVNTWSAQLGSAVNGAAGALGIFAIALVTGIRAMQHWNEGFGRDADSLGEIGRIRGGNNMLFARVLEGLGFSRRDARTMAGLPIISAVWGHSATRADAYGVRGTITGSGVTGENWQDYSQRGGLFSSDRRWTEGTPWSDSQRGTFAGMFRGVSSTTGLLGRLLGLDPSQALAGYTRDFNVQLSDNGNPRSDEDLRQAFGELFASVLQDQVAMLFDAGGDQKLAEYVRSLTGSTDEIVQNISELVGSIAGLKALDLKGLDIHALMAWQREGESVGEAFQRVATAWGDFQNAFLSDDDKLAMAWTSLLDTFGEFGYAVPDSNQAFLDLVASLDLSTEAGRAAFDAFHASIPTFQAVQNAVTSMVNGIIENLRGPMDPQTALNAQLAIFQGNNAWTRGMSLNDIMGALLTITPEDLAAYIRAGQGTNISEISRLYRLIQGGGGGSGMGGGGTPPDVEALWKMVDAANAARDAFEEWKKGLKDWLDGLLVDKSLSPLDPMERLKAAKKLYEDALANQGDVQGAGRTYLQIARELFGSSTAYIDIFKSVYDQVSGVIGEDDYNARMEAIGNETITIQKEIVREVIGVKAEAAENANYVARVVIDAGDRIVSALATADRAEWR